MAIYLYTGNGGGKTTNALGLALRCLGHGMRVLMVQFLKWDTRTGEFEFQYRDCVINDFDVKQFGREGWHGFNNLTKEDKRLCRKGLKFAFEKAKQYDLLILDEINLAVHLGLITMSEMKEFLDNVEAKSIVMTGRHASKELMDLADVVNEVNEIKAPSEMLNERGIQW